MFNKFTRYIFFAAIVVLIGVTTVYAGSLTPPGSPAKTMKTLANLYELIGTGTSTPSTDFATPGTVTSTMRSLDEVYDLMALRIGAINPTNILTGTSLFGVSGTMPSKVGAGLVFTPSTTEQVIDRGYYGGVAGDGKVAGDTNLVAGNIKSGSSIFGVTGKTSVVDTEDANAVASDILTNKTGYVNGVKITGTAITSLGNALAADVLAGMYFSNATSSNILGTMINNVGLGLSYTPSTTDQAISSGYYGGSVSDGKILGDVDLASANIKSGVNIFGVLGKLSVVDTEDADASTTDILLGKTGYVNGIKVTGVAYAGGILVTGQNHCNEYNTNYGNSDKIPCAGTNQDGDLQRGSDAVYADNGDGTISDKVNSIMWQKCADGENALSCAGAASTFLMDDGNGTSPAINICEDLVLGGHSDWHLPNIRELQSVVDYGFSSPAVDSVYFPNTQAGNYWSSTAVESSTTNAWLVNFADGQVLGGNMANAGYVRCVR